jgi:hypothetical protein
MWADARAIPHVQLNCGLVKIMIEEDLGKTDPEDAYVEQITERMSQFIAIQLNKGNSVSVSQAFRHATQCLFI